MLPHNYIFGQSGHNFSRGQAILMTSLQRVYISNNFQQNHVETLSRVPCKQRLSTWTHARYALVEKCPVAEPTW